MIPWRHNLDILMNIRKNLLIVFCLTTLVGIVCLLCFKGIKIKPELDGPHTITVPEGTNIIEIPRRESKEPLRFNIKTPERKLHIDNIQQ